MKKKTTVTILIVLTVLIIFIPLFLIRGAEFEGSDGGGSEMVDEITDGGYEPWFEPVLETLARWRKTLPSGEDGGLEGGDGAEASVQS